MAAQLMNRERRIHECAFEPKQCNFQGLDALVILKGLLFLRLNRQLDKLESWDGQVPDTVNLERPRTGRSCRIESSTRRHNPTEIMEHLLEQLGDNYKPLLVTRIEVLVQRLLSSLCPEMQALLCEGEPLTINE